MKRKTILVAAVCGALIGALSPRLIPNLPVFALDRELLDHRKFLVAAVACWGLFGLYWEIAAKNATTAKTSESKASRAIHVTLANVALLLEIAPIHGLGRFLPASPVVMTLGLAVEVMGLLLAVWARRHLSIHWSGEITIKEGHELIRTGPYRTLRHPIYTGLLMMYVGIAMVTGEWLAVVGVAMAAFAYWRKIRLEEANLVVAFGADYDAYCRATWALVPGVY